MDQKPETPVELFKKMVENAKKRDGIELLKQFLEILKEEIGDEAAAPAEVVTDPTEGGENVTERLVEESKGDDNQENNDDVKIQPTEVDAVVEGDAISTTEEKVKKEEKLTTLDTAASTENKEGDVNAPPPASAEESASTKNEEGDVNAPQPAAAAAEQQEEEKKKNDQITTGGYYSSKRYSKSSRNSRRHKKKGKKGKTHKIERSRRHRHNRYRSRSN